MKKRKNMEERLEEEASKMAELTESAKKKGENKFMSEEAKRGAEERIRAEAEVVAQLERKAAEMALQRENMQKELEAKEDEKKAEIEASSSALKHKRALVEARMKQEEEEIKSLSETAKREVSGSCDVCRTMIRVGSCLSKSPCCHLLSHEFDRMTGGSENDCGSRHNRGYGEASSGNVRETR